ncbi:hypothetical protein HLPCO_001049 [Haloplasma contractile SSD-17B]|uniref:Uncharacterized protein n=1 Tax=Haloplasma contractile SSD-17B TaxID=1033810 RepID=F7PW46_9MOLU|nr:DUF6608 family protein [Haloplasma contractile]ERJ12709.1 hypothetical protein HLPCO_001049 [Haloplasma contractile SSD-17B]
MLKRLRNYSVLICIVYTLLTVLSSSLSLIQGNEYDSHLHLISRFIITTIGVGSIWLYDFLR